MRNLMMISCVAMFCVTASAVSVPTVSNVRVSQNQDTRVVSIEYDLVKGVDSISEAIITVDLQTNAVANAVEGWVSIGGRHCRSLAGDVNRMLSDGTDRKAIWVPDFDLPGVSIDAGCFRAVVKAWPTNSPPDYWAIDLSGGKCHFYYPDADCLPEGIDSDKWRMEQMLMRRIPARNVVWQMGSPENELGRDTSTTYGANMEKQHKVKLTHDYYIGVFEVTQYQMEVARAGSPNASKFTNSLHWATRPAEYTNFADRYHENTDPTSSDPSVRHDCLNWKVTGIMRSRTGLNYYLDLPTEAQWEFACRAGTVSALYDGNDLAAATGEDVNLSKLARYKYTVENINADYSCSTNSGTARVGTYEPNAWGLYDMLGNVAEMCLDCYGSYTNFTDEISVDPLGPKFCGTVPHDTYPAMHRVIRGGSYQSTAAGCRTSSRAREQIWTSSSSTGARMCYTLVNDDIVIEGSLSESVPLATPLVSSAGAPFTAEGSSTLRCVPYGGRVTVR